MRLPTVFVTHGGGPLPVLGDPAHVQLAASLRALPARLGLAAPAPASASTAAASTGLATPAPAAAATGAPSTPSSASAPAAAPSPPPLRAVLLVSAHFEEERPTLIGTPPGKLLYDYGGFPPESYRLRYAPPGAPDVADDAARLLKRAGFSPRLDVSGRGLDHGAFVPLMLMFPEASTPVVELSILTSLSPEEHLRMGEALAPLRDQGVLLVASGSSFHSIPLIFRHMSGRMGGDGRPVGQDFDDFLVDACTAHAGPERARLLSRWASAPGGREAHPREDHLVPLMVAAGAAGGDAGRAERVRLGGIAMSSFVFGGGGDEGGENGAP